MQSKIHSSTPVSQCLILLSHKNHFTNLEGNPNFDFLFFTATRRQTPRADNLQNTNSLNASNALLPDIFYDFLTLKKERKRKKKSQNLILSTRTQNSSWRCEQAQQQSCRCTVTKREASTSELLQYRSPVFAVNRLKR